MAAYVETYRGNARVACTHEMERFIGELIDALLARLRDYAVTNICYLYIQIATYI